MENLQVARLYSQDSITICQQNQMFSKIQQMDLDRALAKQLQDEENLQPPRKRY